MHALSGWCCFPNDKTRSQQSPTKKKNDQQQQHQPTTTMVEQQQQQQAPPLVDLIDVLIARDTSHPDCMMSIDIQQEPNSQLDPSGTIQTQLRDAIWQAILRDIHVDTRRAFSGAPNETWKVKLVVNFYVFEDKDLGNMWWFLFETLNGVLYENDNTPVNGFVATKAVVDNRANACTEIYVTYSSD